MKLMNQLSSSPSLALVFSSFSFHLLSLHIPQRESKQEKYGKEQSYMDFICVILSEYTTLRELYIYHKVRWVTEFKLCTLAVYLHSAQFLHSLRLSKRTNHSF
jgi:hypothetical protein